jgi:hypothetical protein
MDLVACPKYEELMFRDGCHPGFYEERRPPVRGASRCGRRRSFRSCHQECGKRNQALAEPFCIHQARAEGPFCLFKLPFHDAGWVLPRPIASLR